MALTTFRINTPLVASEVIDGEAVVIHFESGCYYSSEGKGAEILALIQTPVSIDDLMRELSLDGSASRRANRQVIEKFVAQLGAEGLIVQSDGEPVEPINGLDTAELAKADIAPPILHKYDDLQDLLLLDPIHDTDEAAWPVARKD